MTPKRFDTGLGRNKKLIGNAMIPIADDLYDEHLAELKKEQDHDR
jgi:hypothetical protein